MINMRMINMHRTERSLVHLLKLHTVAVIELRGLYKLALGIKGIIITSIIRLFNDHYFRIDFNFL